MFDFVVIGGGIVGLATARELLLRHPGSSLLVLEKERELASHQTGHNSGVIHSGIYYNPGSLKARICRSGISKLLSFCEECGIDYDMCGKVIVATDESERPRLHALIDRGVANGVPGLRIISSSELKEIEPYAKGVEAILSPETGIIDFRVVALELAQSVKDKGGVIKTNSKILSFQNGTVCTTTGDFEARNIVCCAGLQADRIEKLSGKKTALLILAFRGEYYKLKSESEYLVNNLIYPVPDPQFPFLGVHFTRRIDGRIEAGPNAVLALAREGYHRTSFDWQDCSQMFRFPGFWRMGLKHWKMAAREYHRSFSKRAFVHDLRRLLPGITVGDLETGGSGVRAMALRSGGELLDDFCITRQGKVVHVLNAPSPAATSALSIAEHVAAILE